MSDVAELDGFGSQWRWGSFQFDPRGHELIGASLDEDGRIVLEFPASIATMDVLVDRELVTPRNFLAGVDVQDVVKSIRVDTVNIGGGVSSTRLRIVTKSGKGVMADFDHGPGKRVWFGVWRLQSKDKVTGRPKAGQP